MFVPSLYTSPKLLVNSPTPIISPMAKTMGTMGGGSSANSTPSSTAASASRGTAIDAKALATMAFLLRLDTNVFGCSKLLLILNAMDHPNVRSTNTRLNNNLDVIFMITIFFTLVITCKHVCHKTISDDITKGMKNRRIKIMTA